MKGKRYQEAAKLVEKARYYDPKEALDLIQKMPKPKFDESVELHVKLGVDSKHAEQQVRGTVVLPHGTGKTLRVLVFAKGDKATEAEKAGVDGLLLVTPYYNKATQNGLYAHFKAVADSVKVPIILYNVPSRTGCNIQPETVVRLCKDVENIVGVKEASGNMSQVVDIFARCGDKLDVYSGEDALTVAMMSMGGAGCISVLSNVAPALTAQMANSAMAGDYATAAQLQCKLLPLINCLFSQVNPIPAKAAVSAMGYGEEHLRLPLTPMEEPFRSAMFAEMRKLGVL